MKNSFKKAIRLKKDYVEAYLELAKIQFAKQNYLEAFETLKEVELFKDLLANFCRGVMPPSAMFGLSEHSP